MPGYDVTDLKWTRRSYSAWPAYGQSKLCNVLYAKGLAKRLEGTPVSAFALHPGVIRTNLQRHMGGCLRAMVAAFGFACKSVPQGAATTVWAATAPELEGHSGAYLADCRIDKPNKLADKPEEAEKLWAATEELVRSVGF